ncbi:SET domain-containing protein [Westerdykella ornata]|uniref:SET domain-containing protein n=1 Tax=Westerdykella ornata TaxID=318751 RepID=A0A6A6JF20_WESOR|nr:SET domain-containing protein [Westerdykella ornata]KAF2274865.1 SET domain-containing protein [Westerdykella ornata]
MVPRLSNGVDTPLFEIKQIPRKGRGLVARINVATGTRILCEKPLLTVQSEYTTPVDAENMFAAQLKALPKASQREFLSLHNTNPGKYPFTGIVRTNALPCGPSSSVGAVYPTICLINHSCVPNCNHSWNSDTGRETIHAIRPIEAGEEITIAYDCGRVSAVRRAFLKVNFGFDCICRACSLPAAELAASDARRERIQALDDAIGDASRMASRPSDCLRDCHALLQALRKEYDGCTVVLSARAYYDAFQICIAHGDEARASVFAERAYKIRVICEGEDSLETQRMLSFARNPASHPTFGICSFGWKRSRAMVPKGLDAEQFEEWLFKMK